MPTITIKGSVALVTGANRGIGRAITEALLHAGAAKVYAAARNTSSLDDLVSLPGSRVVALRLDVTDAVQIQATVEAVDDVELVFNNAGVALTADLTAENAIETARQEMEVNYFGPLALGQRLAPVLARNGGGAIVNMSSVGGLSNFPFFPTYSASKAALHSLTQGLRVLLRGQGTAVFGVYPGPVDTDMSREVAMEKTSPAEVAQSILAEMEGEGSGWIYPDPFAVEFGSQFEASPLISEQQLAAMVAGEAG